MFVLWARDSRRENEIVGTAAACVGFGGVQGEAETWPILHCGKCRGNLSVQIAFKFQS
jgi:hypothetical protein